MRFRIVLQSVALGAVTNVVVAWGCSALASHLGGNTRVDWIGEPFDKWPQGYAKMPLRSYYATLVRWPGVELYTWNYQGPLYALGATERDVAWGDARVPGWSSIQSLEQRDKAQRDNQYMPMMDWRAGWPLATMYGRLTPATLGAWQERFQFREGMLRFRDSVSRIRTGSNMTLSGHLFPLIPVWPGMVVNTVAYAAAWWVGLIGAGLLRKRRREMRGQCVGCGYDRRGLADGVACPECGKGHALVAEAGRGGSPLETG